MLSNEFIEMFKAKKGYRTELYSGSLVRDLKQILLFEIDVLGNSDIITYCEEEHKISLRNDLLKEIDLNENFRVEEIVCLYGSTIAEKLYEFVQTKTGFKKPLGLWLTTKNSVKNYYHAEYDNDIDAYEIPENIMVLSDLGYDGCLFVLNRLVCKG